MGLYSRHTGSHCIDDPPDMGPYIQQDNIQFYQMICKCTNNIKEVIGYLTMIGKLPKSEAWKQSDPDRSGLLLHPRYSSRDPLSKSIEFWQSFHNRANKCRETLSDPKGF
jgi:hypothetical protein